MKCGSVWTLPRLQRHCSVWKSITRCKVTAREYTSTHLAESEGHLSLLFGLQGYRTDPQAAQVKSDMNRSSVRILTAHLWSCFLSFVGQYLRWMPVRNKCVWGNSRVLQSWWEATKVCTMNSALWTPLGNFRKKWNCWPYVDRLISYRSWSCFLDPFPPYSASSCPWLWKVNNGDLGLEVLVNNPSLMFCRTLCCLRCNVKVKDYGLAKQEEQGAIPSTPWPSPCLVSPPWGWVTLRGTV